MNALLKSSSENEPLIEESSRFESISSERKLDSAIYEGIVSHSRFTPKERHFSYRVYMIYAALDEIEALCSKSAFWSSKRWAPARFSFSDYCHGDINLDQAIRDEVENALGFRPEGRVFLLANWRYWGFNMNPLSTFYCFGKDGKLQAVVAEVHNTPWGERHRYVLKAESDAGAVKKRFKKSFTVSPFNPLNMEYVWSSSLPDKNLTIRISTHQDDLKVTDAEMHLQRQEITGKNLNLVLIRYPLMTVKVVVAIYWQALRLFLKGVPFLGKNKVYDFSKKAKPE